MRPPGAAARRRPVLAFRLGRALHRAGLVSERRMERLRQRYGSRDYASATGVLRQVLVRVVGETYEASIRAIAGPVELVWGELDDVAPLVVAEAATALCQAGHLSVCAGAGHLTLTSAPDCVRAAIDRCLQPT